MGRFPLRLLRSQPTEPLESARLAAEQEYSLLATAPIVSSPAVCR